MYTELDYVAHDQEIENIPPEVLVSFLKLIFLFQISNF